MRAFKYYFCECIGNVSHCCMLYSHHLEQNSKPIIDIAPLETVHDSNETPFCATLDKQIDISNETVREPSPDLLQTIFDESEDVYEKYEKIHSFSCK